MSDSLFQVAGVASGIGWDEIIEKMMTVGRKPAEQWQNKIDNLEYKRTLYQEVTSSIYSMRSAMTTLKLPSAYKKKAAEWVVRSPVGADASNIVKATVNANAEIASWDINVTQLATAQRHVSSQFGASDALGITGTVRLQVGIQVAFLEVEDTDTIRTINQKINDLTGPDGNALAVTAKLIDNKLVIESSVTGLDTEGPMAETALYMYDSLYKDIADTGDPTNTVRTYQSYLPQPADGTSFPPQLFMVQSGDTTYLDGLDYDYDATNGIITWRAQMTGETYNPKRPLDGAEIKLVIQTQLANLNSGSGDSLFTADAVFNKFALMPTLPGSVPYKNLPGGSNNAPPTAPNAQSDPNDPLYDPTDADYDSALTDYYANMYTIADSSTGQKYYYGKDYTFDYMTGSDGADYQVIKWKATTTPPSTYVLLTGLDSDYTVNHRQLRMIEDDMTSSDSVLARLGYTTIYEDNGVDKWKFTDGSVTEAQDAKLTINGVQVTRFSNTIPVEDDESDALISNVTLELVGTGDVTMNITQDASEVIENMQLFIDSYNAMMELINFRLEEKYDSNTTSDDDDYLQSILSASKGSTTFGMLHGDQLLWSVKNQMRRYFSESVPSISSDLRSRKLLYPAAEVGAQGSMYINVGAKVARIDISATDSLEDIRKKLNNATSISTDSVDTDGTINSSKKELDLDVEIVNGQLIIKTSSSVTGTGNENHTVKHNAGQAYDQLAFVPDMSPPVNGVMTVSSGSTEYVEDVDYRLETLENDKGILESHIVWLSSGQRPSTSTYQIAYEYDATAVSHTVIPYTGDLSALDLHYDSSNIQLSNLGFTTDSSFYGKSGLIDFDEDVFFEAIKEDPDMVSNVMLSFMDKMDSYIGNLVDSSNVIVGGNIVTKGRFAAALNSIDSEVSSLSEQITKLEKQLEAKQTSLYKQYSSMEQAIQTMNAQMSSMSQYFSNTSS